MPGAATPPSGPTSAGRWTTGNWRLADGTEVQILDVLDDHSRYAVACTAMAHCTGAASFDAFADAAGFLGWPERFWSDNARAFTATLATALAPLGVTASHTRPYSPRSNGKVERFHQTVQKWLTKQPPAATIAELQAQLDLFRLIYNTQRPHRALDRRFPADVWIAAPKSGPPTGPSAPHRIHPSTVHAADTTPAATRSPSAPPTTANTPSPSSPAPRPRLHQRTPHPPTHPRPHNHPNPSTPDPADLPITERKDPRHA